jgi:hypothetical protein
VAGNTARSVMIEWESPDGLGQFGYLRRTRRGAVSSVTPLRCWVNDIHDPLLLRPHFLLSIFK